MISVLIANDNRKEGQEWLNRLERAGYHTVGECGSLSETVEILWQKKVHILLYSATLIKPYSFDVLDKIMDFFPRVKMVIVGTIVNNILSALPPNIAFKKNFDCDLTKYYSLPDDTLQSLLFEEKKQAIKQQTTFLLNEHFLSYEDAAKMLTRVQPKWQPSYVVASILSTSFGREIFQIAKKTANEIPGVHSFEMAFNDTCLVFENSPTLKSCLSIADSLRLKLLKETDATFSIGISRNRYLAGDLYACRNESLRAASSAYLFGQNSVIHINFLGGENILYVYPQHKEKKLIEHTLDGNVLDAVRMLDEIFNILKNQENLKQGIINKICLKILLQLNIAASARAQELEKIQMDSISSGKLLAAKSINDAYLFLKEAVEKFAAEMADITDLRKDIIFMELVKFDKNREVITEKDLGENFETTLGFLNSAVRKNSGDNIFQFLKK